MKNLLLLLSFLFIAQYSYSQDAGLRVYSGITSMSNRVQAITPMGTSHNGFHFGADGRLNGGGMFFVLGVRLTRIDLRASEESKYFSNESAHLIFGGRVGLGWHLIQFGNGISIRGKALAQLDSNVSYEEELLSAPYDSLVDAAAGGVVGLGLEFKGLTLDVEYEYGLVNVYSLQKDSKADVWSVSGGFFF